MNQKVELCISACIHRVGNLISFFWIMWDVSVRIQHKSDVDQLGAKAQLIESNQLDGSAESSMCISGRGMS